ncbi:hypothetical protein BGZ83_004812, partial [Gryganskiella cystojenkinii]
YNMRFFIAILALGSVVLPTVTTSLHIVDDRLNKGDYTKRSLAAKRDGPASANTAAAGIIIGISDGVPSAILRFTVKWLYYIAAFVALPHELL